MEGHNNSELMDDQEYSEAFEQSFEKENQKFEELIKQKLIISLYGDVNAGKSSTINALTGKKLADVRAISGHTKEVSLHVFNENVFIADTPGLNDINEDLSKKTDDFVAKDADIILFFFKATGITKPEITAFKELEKLGKPIITVLNLIDIWYENGELIDKEDFADVISQIEQNTGQKVIPISAKKKIYIEKLNSKILNILESEGKDLLYLKITKYKEEKVKVWINGAVITAAGIGAIPVPAADIIPLTSLQVGLALKIAYIYNCKVSKSDVMQLLASTVTGAVGKQLFRIALQVLKALGLIGGPFGASVVAVVAALVASSVTYGFGWAANAYYKSGMEMDLGEVGIIYKEMYEQYHKKS